MRVRQFPGPDREMEGIRAGIAELVRDQDERQQQHQGKWRIEASLQHSPVPWSRGIITDDPHFLLGRAAEVVLIELGYRAAWRMGCETVSGETYRFQRDLLQQCRDHGHDMVEMTGGWADYARDRGFTKHCPRCGHIDGETCRCRFCELVPS